MSLSTSTFLCSYLMTIRLRNIFVFPNRNLTPTPIPDTTEQSLVTTIPVSVCMNLPILGTLVYVES